MSHSKRLDKYLTDHCGIRSRSLAAQLIKLGCIKVFQKERELRAKPSLEVDTLSMRIEMIDHPLMSSVSRGRLKLSGAIKNLDLDLTNQQVLDIGQSTGGFTQACLDHGAKFVLGIDVGHNQLDSSLRSDVRVRCFENFHVKNLSSEWLKQQIGQPKLDLIVMDLSFISIKPFIPMLLSLTDNFLSLVKPQFELGRKSLDKKGIVRESAAYSLLESEIVQQIRDCHGTDIKYFPSSLTGGDGNREFFIWCQAPF